VQPDGELIAAAPVEGVELSDITVGYLWHPLCHWLRTCPQPSRFCRNQTPTAGVQASLRSAENLGSLRRFPIDWDRLKTLVHPVNWVDSVFEELGLCFLLPLLPPVNLIWTYATRNPLRFLSRNIGSSLLPSKNTLTRSSWPGIPFADCTCGST